MLGEDTNLQLAWVAGRWLYCIRTLGSIFGKCVQGAGPVSYTHLDVYKRQALDRAAADYTKALAGTQGKPLQPDRLKTLNQDLALAERKLTNPQGLPRRPWMQHLLYAPGWYTGYSAKTLPGVREAIEEGRYTEAEEQVVLVARALRDEAAWVEQLSKELGEGSGGSAP